MKSLRILSRGWLIYAVALGFAMMATPGCLVENRGTTETSVGVPVTTPPDFNVNPEQPAGGRDTNNQASQQPGQSVVLEEGFTINNMQGATRDRLLKLDITTLNPHMKITFNQDCSGGAWEPTRPTVMRSSPISNNVVHVSVQFRDWDLGVGECYRQSIVHDDVGPTIHFPVYPLQDLAEGSTADLTMEVTDAGTGVRSVVCSLNGISKPCNFGRSSVSFTAMPEGFYTFVVEAVDNLGNTSRNQVSWTVTSSTRALLSDIRVNDYKKVDILIVIDNSGSMQYEQQSMASRVRNLMRVIRGLDYQIAVTTTDPRDIPLGDGRFIPIWGTQNQFIIDPSTPEEVAQERLGKTLQRPETGYGLEQPIRVVYRAIERSRDGRNPVHAQFFRQDAQFAVLVISDEDESDNTPKNDPENLIALVNNAFNGQKRFSFHSIITRPGDVACRSTHGAAYGERLARMSELTGGIIGSVCETDYGAQLSGIGEGIRNLLKTLTLQCQPLTQCPITIKRNGVVQSSLNFVVEGVNLRFATELEPGDYQVSYRCLR